MFPPMVIDRQLPMRAKPRVLTELPNVIAPVVDTAAYIGMVDLEVTLKPAMN